MNRKIANCCKKIIPKKIYPAIKCFYNNIFYRDEQKKYRDQQILNAKKTEEILDYYTAYPAADSEIKEIIEYLPTCGKCPFPYPWADMKKAMEVKVFHDKSNGLPYVLMTLNGDKEKRLYFPSDMDDESIRNYYYFTQMIEQHALSPHRYLTDNFTVSSEDIVLDLGVAEGNFSLAAADKVKKIYLFEPEERWIKPLNATFAPWKDKIEIVSKYVSDEDSEDTISLDTFFKDKTIPTFIKMDIEGFEEKALLGAKKILQSPELKKLAVCAYHYHDAEDKLTVLLQDSGFDVTPVNGYMIFDMYDELRPPYFRRGVLRAARREN